MWKVWYEDTFDRECPRQVQAEGQGLVQGLAELWSRHLRESVQPDGRLGFARFNLWWRDRSIEIADEPHGAARVRAWVEESTTAPQLLRELAEAHAYLIHKQRDSTTILALAVSAQDRDDFVTRLSTRNWV